MQKLINAAATFCDMVGMIVCTVKTKVVVFGPQSMPPIPWFCKGESLQQMQEFKYLGLMFSAQGRCAGNLPHPEAKDDGCLGAAQAAVWQVIMCFIGWPTA